MAKLLSRISSSLPTEGEGLLFEGNSGYVGSRNRSASPRAAHAKPCGRHDNGPGQRMQATQHLGGLDVCTWGLDGYNGAFQRPNKGKSISNMPGKGTSHDCGNYLTVQNHSDSPIFTSHICPPYVSTCHGLQDGTLR
jgi:hypothetical protein